VTDTSKLPIHLNRAELDRVIRRAVELQLHEGSDEATEATLSEEEVLRIGEEVGLGVVHVRRALGELRAEALVPALPADEGPLGRFIGPGHVRAERAVTGSADQVEDRLVRWLTEAESLHVVRRRAGVSLLEPAEGFIAQLQRGLKWGGQRYELARARQVELSVQDLEDGFSLVTLTVDLTHIRLEQGAGSAAGFATGGAVVGSVVTMAATAFPPVAVVACGLGGAVLAGAGGLAIGRTTYARQCERVELAAEGLLDRLERGELVKPPKRRI
jgi:hypothetical protein